MGSCLTTADEDELAEDVQVTMAKMLHRKPIITTTEEESDSMVSQHQNPPIYLGIHHQTPSDALS